MTRDDRLVPVEPGASVRMTVEAFEGASATVWRTELVRGLVVREPPAGGEHGIVAARLLARLARHVEEEGLGIVFAAETGFRLSGDPEGTVRAPDAAFVSRDRIPEGGPPRGFWPGAPDLAAEVASPADSADRVLEKVVDYLEAGTRLVWVLHPSSRSVTVYRSRNDIEILGEDGALEGGEVLPGLRIPVREVFPV